MTDQRLSDEIVARLAARGWTAKTQADRVAIEKLSHALSETTLHIEKPVSFDDLIQSFIAANTAVTIDPQDCGCTDCIVGDSINPSQLDTTTVIGLMQRDITLINRSSGNLTFTIERVPSRRIVSSFDVFLMDPWRNTKTGRSWQIERSDLRLPVSYLALSFDEDGLIIG